MDDFDAGTGLRGYGRVLSYGPAARPFAAAVVARLPIGMNALGMVLLIQQVRGAYALAGIITGVFALATAVGAPVWGRLMDRHGQPVVLLPTAVVAGLAVAGISLATVWSAPSWVLVTLAIIAGVAFPPMSPAMRVAWRVVFTHETSRRMGYALDAASVEMIFVVGPLLLSLLASLTPPAVPLLVASALLIVGTVAYCATAAARTRLVHDIESDGEADTDGEPNAHGATPDTAAVVDGERFDRQPAITAPGVAGVLTVALVMAIGFGQFDTSMVATANVVFGTTKRLGLLFAFIAGGSAVGGLVYGARHDWPGRESTRLVVMLGAFAVLLVPLPFLLHRGHVPLPMLFATLFCAGLTISPSLIMFQNLLDRFAPPRQATEVQALLSASQTTGAAAGTAISGFTVDAWAAPGGVAGAAMAMLSSALVAVVLSARWRRTRNDV